MLTRPYFMLNLLCGHALHWQQTDLTLWCAWSCPCWFIGFFCGPHSLLPGIAHWLVLVLGGCQACAWLPSARAFQGSLQGLGRNRRFFPLFSLHSHRLAQHRQIPMSLSFSCWGIGVSGDTELFSLFLNDRHCCSSDRSDFCICTFSRGSWVCQRSNRKLKEF